MIDAAGTWSLGASIGRTPTKQAAAGNRKDFVANGSPYHHWFPNKYIMTETWRQAQPGTNRDKYLVYVYFMLLACIYSKVRSVKGHRLSAPFFQTKYHVGGPRTVNKQSVRSVCLIYLSKNLNFKRKQQTDLKAARDDWALLREIWRCSSGGQGLVHVIIVSWVFGVVWVWMVVLAFVGCLRNHHENGWMGLIFLRLLSDTYGIILWWKAYILLI